MHSIISSPCNVAFFLSVLPKTHLIDFLMELICRIRMSSMSRLWMMLQISQSWERNTKKATSLLLLLIYLSQPPNTEPIPLRSTFISIVSAVGYLLFSHFSYLNHEYTIIYPTTLESNAKFEHEFLQQMAMQPRMAAHQSKSTSHVLLMPCLICIHIYICKKTKDAKVKKSPNNTITFKIQIFQNWKFKIKKMINLVSLELKLNFLFSVKWNLNSFHSYFTGTLFISKNFTKKIILGLIKFFSQSSS